VGEAETVRSHGIILAFTTTTTTTTTTLGSHALCFPRYLGET
jgi:hypothetical protein